MTNKQSWEEEFDKKFPRPYQGDYRGLHTATKNFISQLLTSKAEQMEGEKKNTVTFEMLDNEEAEVRNYEMAFNAGISKCIEILKK